MLASTSTMAEIVLHRRQRREPQTLDQAHTSIDVESNILKDLYEVSPSMTPVATIKPGVAES